MKKITLVCISYNTGEETKKFIETNEKLEIIDKIVLVDNNSSAEEKEIIKSIHSDKLVKIFNEANLGFDKANTIGLKYALNINDSEYIFIANTDILFTEEVLINSIGILESNSNIGVVAPSMIHPNGKVDMSPRDLPTMKSMFRDCFFLLRRRFMKKNSINYHKIVKSNYEIVEAVNGGLLVFKKKALIDCDYFDTNIFMYFDEDALCLRLKNKGYDTAYYPDGLVIHDHNYNKPSIPNKLRLKISIKSTSYYFKTYITKNLVLRFFFNTLLFFHYFEMSLVNFFRSSKK